MIQNRFPIDIAWRHFGVQRRAADGCLLSPAQFLALLCSSRTQTFGRGMKLHFGARKKLGQQREEREGKKWSKTSSCVLQIMKNLGWPYLKAQLVPLLYSFASAREQNALAELQTLSL